MVGFPEIRNPQNVVSVDEHVLGFDVQMVDFVDVEEPHSLVGLVTEEYPRQ